MKNLFLVFILVALNAGAAAAQQPPPENYYGAGNQIDIRTPVPGDAVIAGRLINIDEEVAGDVLAAGWHISIAHRVLDDVRLVGAEVIVDAPIEGDLTAAGGNIAIGRNTHIAGRAWITGGTIRIDGVVDREIQIAGGTVQIGGEIRKPLRVTAETFEILPNAHILATVTYSGPKEAIISDQAQVTGPIAFHRIAAADAKRTRWTSAVSSTLFAIHLIVAGLLLLVLLPRVASASVETLQSNPLASFVVGFVMLVTIPVAVVVLLVTVLGAPIGFTLAALYFVGLLLGVVTTASYLGQIEARWFKFASLSARNQNAIALVAGTISLALMRSLFGGLVVFVAILFGFGALGLLLYRSRVRFGFPMA